MLQQQTNEVLTHPDVANAIVQLQSAGVAQDVITGTINTAIGGITNEPTRVAAQIVAQCLIKKLKEYEATNQPKTFFGKLIKSIFG